MLLKDLNGFPQLTQKRKSTYINTHTQTEKKTNDNNKAQNNKMTMQQQVKKFHHVQLLRIKR